LSPSPLSARAFFRDPVGYVRTHGEAMEALRFAAGRRGFVLARDPETVWRVLVTDADSFRPGKWKRRARRFLGDTLNTLEGAEHRRRRLLVQPVLDRRRIAGFAPAIAARVERSQARWEHGARIGLRDTLDPLALTVAGDVLLSTDLGPRAPELADALAAVMTAVPRLTPPVRGTAGARALARLDGAVGEAIAEHRRSRDAQDDLVGALLAAGLPERTVRGEVVAFLLAAVDEPPSALEAVWYLLGRNPAAEARFHDELDALTAGRPALDDEDSPRYLRAVILETLRLFPPARHIDRCPLHDVRVGGVRAAAGSNVLVSPLVTHREPQLYPRSAEFAPERWLERPVARNGSRGAYVPFGAGAHTCIGEPLAWAIMASTLATIGRRRRVGVHQQAPAPGPRSPRLVVRLERR
jgi:cytochrome P450